MNNQQRLARDYIRQNRQVRLIAAEQLRRALEAFEQDVDAMETYSPALFRRIGALKAALAREEVRRQNRAA